MKFFFSLYILFFISMNISSELKKKHYIKKKIIITNKNTNHSKHYKKFVHIHYPTVNVLGKYFRWLFDEELLPEEMENLTQFIKILLKRHCNTLIIEIVQSNNKNYNIECNKRLKFLHFVIKRIMSHYKDIKLIIKYKLIKDCPTKDITGKYGGFFCIAYFDHIIMDREFIQNI